MNSYNYDSINFFIIFIVSSISLILYIIYLSLVLVYITKNYHTKELSVFWIDFLYLTFAGIIFIISYIINLIYNNNVRYKQKDLLIDSIFSYAIILSLTTMIVTISGSLLFDAITTFKLSSKINEIKKIIETDLLAVSERIKNIEIPNILKLKYTCKYYIIFTIFNIICIVLCFFSSKFTNDKNYNKIFYLSSFFGYLIRYYHLISFFLFIFSIIYMNKSKKHLLNKNYYNKNRIAQKVYSAHLNQIIYLTDVITFKLISDLIISVTSLFFLSLGRLNTFTLLFSEIAIFIYILLFGNENIFIDYDNKAGKLNKSIVYFFCFKKINFHFGGIDNFNIFDEIKLDDSDAEKKVLNELKMSLFKNIENISLDFSEVDGSFLGLNKSNSFKSFKSIKSINSIPEIKDKKLNFKNISEFYLIQKMMMLYFIKNKKIYELAMDKIDESFPDIKKNKTKRKSLYINSQNRDSLISNIDRLSKLTNKDIGKIQPSIKIQQNALFTSIEEKELFEELKNKFNLKNDKYIYKIESLLSYELFEIFPLFQMKINNIIKSLNPARNIKIFNKFIKRNNNNQNNFKMKRSDSRISIRSIKSNNFINKKNSFNLDKNENKKELEKDLYYTHDLYLMYEIYDKKDFLNYNELETIISEYNKYLFSVVKNMKYTFLPLILGIFSIEVYDSNKIIILYRNPLFFTNFKHFNHWINFYITEEPEKIKVSSLFNDVIDVNEIEIKNTLLLNELDYEEIKNNLQSDYSFLINAKNIYPIIHLFIGDENYDEGQANEDEDQKLKKNQCLENSIIGFSLNDDLSFDDILEGDTSFSFINNNNNNNKEKNEIDENSFFDKEYYFTSGNDVRTIKIYFTNLFRKDCELNQIQNNSKNKVNSALYCKYLQDQIINYLKKKSLFNDEEKN